MITLSNLKEHINHLKSVLPMGSKVESSKLSTGLVKGFMCRTDFLHELGEHPYGVKVFPSLEALRRAQDCVMTCGYVEVEIRYRSEGEIY